MTDQNEIPRALKLWFRAGDVFEVRVLEAVTAEYMRPHVESGYFDFEYIEAAAEALARLRGYRGAYVTVNPVNSDLLATCMRRDLIALLDLRRESGDCLYALKGWENSRGAKAEIAVAKFMDLPVCFEMDLTFGRKV